MQTAPDCLTYNAAPKIVLPFVVVVLPTFLVYILCALCVVQPECPMDYVYRIILP